MASHRSLPLEEGHESLSHSRRDAFRRCRRYFWLKYEQGINQRELSAPLRMGGIYADALESGDPEVAKTKYNDLIVEAMHDSQSYMVDKYLDELAVVQPMVATYLSHVSNGDNREVEFVGLTANGFQDNGRLDGLNLDSDNPQFANVLEIVENKLKGRWERAMEADVRLSEDQLTSYFVNVQKMYSADADQIKARYEVAKKPQLRQKKDETREAFRSRVSADILSRPEFYHVIVEGITRTQDQLDEWAVLFERMTLDIKQERLYEANGSNMAWPKNPRACPDFGGCEMARICWAKSEDEVAQVIATDFIIEQKEEPNG